MAPTHGGAECHAAKAATTECTMPNCPSTSACPTEGSYEITQVHDVKRMVVEGFRNVWISAFYLISVAILGLHLNHGAAALFRSLGIGNRATFPWQNLIARALGLFIFLGMAAIPLGVLTGVIK